MSDALLDEFVQHGFSLSPSATVRTHLTDFEWRISGEQPYLIRRNFFQDLDVYSAVADASPDDEVSYGIDTRWIGCKPNWNVAELLHTKYAVVGGRGDLGSLTATPPWRTIAKPFPIEPNVDKEYWYLLHWNIVGYRQVFDDAVAWIYPNDPPVEAQAMQVSTQAIAEPSNSEQQLDRYEGELAAG